MEQTNPISLTQLFPIVQLSLLGDKKEDETFGNLWQKACEVDNGFDTDNAVCKALAKLVIEKTNNNDSLVKTKCLPFEKIKDAWTKDECKNKVQKPDDFVNKMRPLLKSTHGVGLMQLIFKPIF